MNPKSCFSTVRTVTLLFHRTVIISRRGKRKRFALPPLSPLTILPYPISFDFSRFAAQFSLPWSRRGFDVNVCSGSAVPGVESYRSADSRHGEETRVRLWSCDRNLVGFHLLDS